MDAPHRETDILHCVLKMHKIVQKMFCIFFGFIQTEILMPTDSQNSFKNGTFLNIQRSLQPVNTTVWMSQAFALTIAMAKTWKKQQHGCQSKGSMLRSNQCSQHKWEKCLLFLLVPQCSKIQKIVCTKVHRPKKHKLILAFEV